MNDFVRGLQRREQEKRQAMMSRIINYSFG